MIFMKYKQPRAEHVQFQRLVFGLLVLTAVLSKSILFIYIYLFLSIFSFITTVNYSPTTIIFKFASILNSQDLFVTPAQYAHSYIVHRLAEIFEDLMRISGGIAIIYLYSISELAAWMMSSFMAIAMLISSFFGFCLSSLLYISYRAINRRLKEEDK